VFHGRGSPVVPAPNAFCDLTLWVMRGRFGRFDRFGSHVWVTRLGHAFGRLSGAGVLTWMCALVTAIVGRTSIPSLRAISDRS
jgi:hypothetical protein